jgi:hypothetical protein
MSWSGVCVCVLCAVQNETEWRVCCAVQNEQHTTHMPPHDMLPHHHITYKDIILPGVLI